ncbi:MAG: hypothetical protein AAF850_09545 [Pseudomonadota bacterium]
MLSAPHLAFAQFQQTDLARDPFATGVEGAGRLPSTLWRGADAETLAALLDLAPAAPQSAAIGRAISATLNSSGEAPTASPAALGGQKLLALARAGFIDDAKTIASLSSAKVDDASVARGLAIADLLSNDLTAACRRNAGLSDGRDDPFWVKLRVLCYANANEMDAADLTFNILKERGVLSAMEAVALNAAAVGGKPTAPITPSSPILYAALNALDLEINPDDLALVTGGVARAITNDRDAPVPLRLNAASRAALMGVMDADDIKRLFGSISVDASAIDGVTALIAAQPDDLYTDVVLFQAIQRLNTPDSLRDKAALIADAIRIADTLGRLTSAATLYDDDIRALEGALVTADEALQFAFARLLIGDAKGAARWIFAVDPAAASEENTSLTQTLIGAINLLSLIDPVAANAASETFSVAIDRRLMIASDGGSQMSASDEDIAHIIRAAIDAAASKSQGQASLAAIAVSGVMPVGAPIAQAIIGPSLRNAGLIDLADRLKIEAAIRNGAASWRDTTTVDAPEKPRRQGFTPRIKPDPTG